MAVRISEAANIDGEDIEANEQTPSETDSCEVDNEEQPNAISITSNNTVMRKMVEK